MIQNKFLGKAFALQLQAGVARGQLMFPEMYTAEENRFISYTPQS